MKPFNTLHGAVATLADTHYRPEIAVSAAADTPGRTALTALPTDPNWLASPVLSGGSARQATQVEPTTNQDNLEVRTAKDSIKDKLDSMSELGEAQSLRLQMAMDRVSKLMQTLSNILKKIADTASAVVSNLK
jgi:hypothetical protein